MFVMLTRTGRGGAAVGGGHADKDGGGGADAGRGNTDKEGGRGGVGGLACQGGGGHADKEVWRGAMRVGGGVTQTVACDETLRGAVPAAAVLDAPAHPAVSSGHCLPVRPRPWPWKPPLPLPPPSWAGVVALDLHRAMAVRWRAPTRGRCPFRGSGGHRPAVARRRRPLPEASPQWRRLVARPFS